ncbi:MAG: NAD-dependent epimerase/dehydratase family protein [Bacteroidetes bacterium]|nr:MAG: NAD-dependent epimerase/dehydratase family protein [Bacteroidota bacterium]REK00805.1 MAG: NAD-dependent epimerase/dehydratase family protein [Bacteroidota bacterium]REK35296.1 MAG: NAD-dependent epimerase/dehydratase family protein [Bacteroidota bacterium]REK48376.1 MAG: NAD-dependent epimerase/dehydratase family protein [Bacteroidota bacterium]
MKEHILVIGANGQIGGELVEELRKIHGSSYVIATDIKDAGAELKSGGPFRQLDVLDHASVFELIKENKVREVYLLAALLSATAESKIRSAWKLNMEGLFGLLEMARQENFKLFWPSSIAVFGPGTPRQNTPQHTITEPSTVYGISKLAGERWCEYYHKMFGTDVRSIRYPGLIGYKTEPGGGTTDYAVSIFHNAIRNKQYECYLSAGTALPMMYMPDAIRATLELMNADSSKLSIRSSYNIDGMSFTPEQIAGEIKLLMPDFRISYKPDIRQQYADSWPQSIDGSVARNDWGWTPRYDIKSMCKEMFQGVQQLITSH